MHHRRRRSPKRRPPSEDRRLGLDISGRHEKLPARRGDGRHETTVPSAVGTVAVLGLEVLGTEILVSRDDARRLTRPSSTGLLW